MFDASVGGVTADKRRAAVPMFLVCERFGDTWLQIGLVNTPEEAEAWLNEEGCFTTNSIAHLRMLEGKPCK